MLHLRLIGDCYLNRKFIEEQAILDVVLKIETYMWQLLCSDRNFYKLCKNKKLLDSVEF